MAYGQPPPLPPWAAPAPDPSALPANDLGTDPFIAWLHGAERAQPILQPPPESPVPDVAWSGPPPIEFTADEAFMDAPDARAERRAPWGAAGDVDPALTGNQDPTTRKPINPYGPGYVDPDVDPALTGSQDPTVRKPSDPYGPGYIDPDVDPALVGDQDPTIRKPLDPYANGDIVPGRTFGAPVGYAPTPADRAEQDRLVTPLDPYDPAAIAGRVESSADAYAKATPEERARIDAREAAMFETRRQTEEMKALEADRQALEANIKARAAAKAKTDAEMAAIAADTKAMSDASPFESWWSDRSTGQKIANGIAAIFGGLLAPAGGRNSAIDLMLKVADDDAAAKWKKLAARRENVGDMQAAAQNDFIEAEKIRLVGREQVARQIQAQLATLDPEGSQAIALGKTLAGLQEQRMQAWAALGEKMQARNDAEAAQALEVAKHELEVAKAEDTSKLAWARFKRAGQGTGGTGLFSKNARYAPAVWAQIIPGLDPAKLPDIKLTHDELIKIVEAQGKFGQQGVDAARGKGIELENTVKAGGLRIYDPRDSSRVIGNAKDEKAAQVVNDVLPASVQATETIDRIIRIANESGGNSDTIKNKEWQAITADKAYLDNLIRVAEKMGALDAGSQDLIGKMRGGVDPNSFLRDAGPGLRRLRANIVNRAQKTLNSAGLNGSAYAFPDMSDPPKAPIDEEGARLSSRRRPADALRDAGRQIAGSINPDDYSGLTDDNRAALRTLQADMGRADQEVAQRAAAQLAEAAVGGASNPAAVSAAAYTLWTARKAGNAAAEGAFQKFSRTERASILAHLPEEEARAAFAELFPGGR